MLIPTDPQISETLECIANKVRLVLNSTKLYSDLPYECFIPNFGESGNRHEFIFILRPFPQRIKKKLSMFPFFKSMSWYQIEQFFMVPHYVCREWSRLRRRSAPEPVPGSPPPPPLSPAPASPPRTCWSLCLMPAPRTCRHSVCSTTWRYDSKDKLSRNEEYRNVLYLVWYLIEFKVFSMYM